MRGSSEQYTKAKKLLFSNTLVPFPLDDFKKGLDSKELSQDIHRVFSAFEYNLNESIDIAAWPLAIGGEIADRELFKRLHIASRIRARPLLGDGEDIVDEDFALKEAREKFKNLTANLDDHPKDGSYDHLLVIISKTNEFFSTQKFRDKSQSLLRQATVLAWNALEVLVRDVLEVIMNERKDLAIEFVKDPDASSKFDLKKVSLLSLETFDFDISRKLGSFVLEGRDLSDIASIQVSLKAFFKDHPNLHVLLKSRVLYYLCKKRHLFVHRRGIVDPKFLKETECKTGVGDQLFVMPEELEDEIRFVWSVGAALYSSIVSL